MKKVIILGATGSVGSSTLAVIRDNPGMFEVVGIAAGQHSQALLDLAAVFPEAAVAAAKPDMGDFQRSLCQIDHRGQLFHGEQAIVDMVRTIDADICVAAISGTAGLRPTFAAVEKGMRILLANKEVLVSAGELFLAAAAKSGAEVLPVDSEHAALWQCLECRDMRMVEKVIITASGGPFRTWSRVAMDKATPKDAVQHPVWRMGAKISVDSATLANKALEVIEAKNLFSLPFESIEVLVHPQSVVHGMVEFNDGSIFAHMGIADMRQPISYMLFYPERRRNTLPRLNLAAVARLDFELPDLKRFPMLQMGLNACREGGCYPALYNAANETAVELFLGGVIGFGTIAAAVEVALATVASNPPACLDEVLVLHDQARRVVRQYAGLEAE